MFSAAAAVRRPPPVDYGEDLVIKWDTYRDNLTVLLETPNAYPIDASPNYTVDWGDGSAPENITIEYPSHVYATMGVYIMRISGFCPKFLISDSSNRTYINEVLQLGRVGLETILVSGDEPNGIGLISFNAAPCDTAYDPLGNGFHCYLQDNPGLTMVDISGMSTINTTSYTNAYSNNPLLVNFDATQLNMEGVTDRNNLWNMFLGTPWNNTQYSDALIAWEAQSLNILGEQPGQDFPGLNHPVKYEARAAAARASLIDTYKWAISDSGPV